MEPVAALGIAIVVIFALIEAIKRIFPSLNSNYIPLIALVLGLGACVLIFFTIPATNLWILFGALIPALGASGLYSQIQVVKNVSTNKTSTSTTETGTLVSPNEDYPASN